MIIPIRWRQSGLELIYREGAVALSFEAADRVILMVLKHEVAV
jgi:hypothetical protein